MDIDEARVYAGEQIIAALCGGKEFNGLGTEAYLLILAVTQSASDNAKLINDKMTRPQEAFNAMVDTVRQQFVLDILGFGENSMSPQQAAYKLVDSVWNAYIQWAKDAQ